ncbi:MAG: bifunctional biotin--[acetyl-CoA-carboxylase] ligase/biotin operon repressor BirA [Sedimenticola sp.]
METRYKIVRLLADGRFHSGEEMAGSLAVSRAAIWKQLKAVKEQLGLEVFAVRGKGYRLAQPLELLDQEKIEQALTPSIREHLYRLEIHPRLDSTNSYLMQAGNDGSASGHVCLVEQQTAGKGRRGREWVSPFGSNIYLSLLWRYSLGLADLSGLSLAVGLGVVRSLEMLGVTGVGLKWPNDVLYQDQKLAGLLLEVAGEQGGPSRVVVGLGLNTRLTGQQGAAIDQPWTDLTQLPGGDGVSRNQLAGVLVSQLLEIMDQFGRDGLTPLLKEWHRYDIYYGRAVTLQMGTRQIEGIHRGINDAGALLLEEGGAIRVYHGGEVSLRSTKAVGRAVNGMKQD